MVRLLKNKKVIQSSIIEKPHNKSSRIENYSVSEPHHFYAAPATGKIFDTAPAAPAPAPTLLYSKAKFLK
jgi:hypothetical protein